MRSRPSRIGQSGSNALRRVVEVINIGWDSVDHMRILLIGASGMVGSRVAAELRGRGHEVTGVTRSGTDGTVVGDAADRKRIAELAAGHDALVVAISAPRDNPDPEGPVLAAGQAVLDAARDAGVRRIVIVGGAGSLEVAPGVRLIDTPEFPDAYKPPALAHAKLLEVIRDQAGDLEWTYISPAPEIAPGERTGRYRRGGDRLLEDARSISAEDYAVALADELERGEAIGARIGVAY